MSSRAKGLAMVVTGAALWGLSGTAAQILFQEKNVTTEWLVAVRMVLAGFVLVVLSALKGLEPFAIWKDRKSRWQLILFGLVGMLGVQYTYFASIATGNAATATLLQYLAPVYIVLYSLVKEKQKPTIKISFAIFLALAGTFLLMTNGTTNQFTVSLVSVVWGVLSGVALAFYTLASAKLLKTWPTMLVVGWGMVIGGAAMCWLVPSLVPTNIVSGVDTWLLIMFVVLFGTLMAFLLFVESIRHLSPTESSLLSSVEPLSAVLASIVFLHVSFGVFQAVGAACILWTVFLLSEPPKKRMYRNIEGV